MTQKETRAAPELTQDEITILDLLTAGLGKQEIADQLHIDNMRAVERHFDRITEKFSAIDGRLGRVKGQTGGEGEIGYVGRIATILRIYREHYIEKKADPQPLFYVRRRDVRFEMDITEDLISIEAEVRIQSLRDQLAFVAHGLILEDQSPQADASHQHLEASTMAQGVRVSSEIAINDPKTPRFRIRFEPPLKLGQEISYHYGIRSANYFPMSLEQIKERKAGGFYHLDEGVCETTYTISTPTDHLALQLTFPPLFGITNEHVKVEVGRSGPPNHEEEKRIQDTYVLSTIPFGTRTRLAFDLKQPLLNHRYRIRWSPTR